MSKFFNSNKWFFRVVGWVVTLIVIYPYALEYLGFAPEKEFGFKEGIFLTLSFYYAVGYENFKTFAQMISKAAVSRLSGKKNNNGGVND